MDGCSERDCSFMLIPEEDTHCKGLPKVLDVKRSKN